MTSLLGLLSIGTASDSIIVPGAPPECRADFQLPATSCTAEFESGTLTGQDDSACAVGKTDDDRPVWSFVVNDPGFRGRLTCSTTTCGSITVEVSDSSTPVPKGVTGAWYSGHEIKLMDEPRVRSETRDGAVVEVATATPIPCSTPWPSQ